MGSNPTPSAVTPPLTDDDAMRLALDRGCRGRRAHGDVPIGAVVVRDGEVIAARHNERELTGDPTAHAEVLAIRDAATSSGTGGCSTARCTSRWSRA